MPMSWKTDMSSLIMKAGDDSINIYMQYGELNHLLTLFLIVHENSVTSV